MLNGTDEKSGEGDVGCGGRSGIPKSSNSDGSIPNKRPKLQPENLPEEVAFGRNETSEVIMSTADERIVQLERNIHDLTEGLKKVEENSGEDRIALRELQTQVSELDKSIKKLLESLTPRVEAHLAASGEGAAAVPLNSPKAPLLEFTSLLEAVENGDLGAVTGYLNGGANVNQRNERGWTALHLAADNGCKEIAAQLIEHGAGVNALGNLARTPLHIAAIRGDESVGRLLLSSGAAVAAKDSRGFNPFVLALENKRTYFLFSLIPLVVSKTEDNDNDNVLNNTDLQELCDKAVTAGSCGIVRLLIQICPGKLRLEELALSVASQKGQLEILRMILNSVENDGDTEQRVANKVLSVAKDVSTISFIEDKYPGILQKPETEDILLDAVRNRHIHTMVALLDSGVKYSMDELLKEACHCDRFECVEELLKRGASKSVALTYAKKYYEKERIVKLLESVP